MKKLLYYIGIWICLISITSCTDNNPQNTIVTEPKTELPLISLPQTWTKVPDTGINADSVEISRLQFQPDTTGPEPEWKIVGKISGEKWYGLLYTYKDINASELHLATYTSTDSLLSDIILIQDRVVGILTSGTFSANITQTFAIKTNERLKSKASETDSTIISDEQIVRQFQIEESGRIKTIANKAIDNATQAATHPEEEQEGGFYQEYRYESPDAEESFVYTIMGQEREKHYYFENKEGNQHNLTLVGIAENNSSTYEFKLDGQNLSAQWEKYTQEGEFSIPQRIVFTYANGKKLVFTRTE